MISQRHISIKTQGRGLHEITDFVTQKLQNCQIEKGLAHIFIQHTSASLVITENADSTVLQDLETIMTRLAPDADPEYLHNYEGDDDMAAHVRSVITSSDLTIPIVNSHLALGTWQGIYLWEHRYRPHQRNVVLTFTS